MKYQDWKSEFTDNVGTPIYSATNKSWGVGREVGFDASLGIAEVVSLFAGAGYKVEWLDGINYTTSDDDDHDEPGGRGGELIHGPFARLGFRFP